MLLRLYGGELYSDFMTISEMQLASALKQTVQEVKLELLQLHQLQLLAYEPAIDNARITFVLARQDADHLPIQRASLAARRTLHLEKMEAIIHYAEQNHRCRMQVIQEYFDEVTFSTCEICDVCIDKRKVHNHAILLDYQNQIGYLMAQRPLSPDELEQQAAPEDREMFIEVLREMVDAGQLYYDEHWILHLKTSPK
jgi:ATP-dependent DNA helicase RecQ